MNLIRKKVKFGLTVLFLVACFIGILVPSKAQVTNLENFGYNVLRPPSHLPVVLIIVNYQGQPAYVHNNYYYELLLRNNVALFYRAMSDGRVTLQHAGTINVSQSSQDLQLPERRRLAKILQEAGRSSFDFRAYDANHDGTVTHNELGILIIDNVTERGAANRETDPASVAIAQNVNICAKLALAGHQASLSSMAHELSHSLNTIDLYGNYSLSQNLTLMGATIFPNEDDMQLFHLDPWHKMALGWHRPIILSLQDPHMNLPLHAKASDSPYNSYILYAPAKGTREFFMVEFRTPNATSASGMTRTIDDTNVPGTGLVLWHVNLGTDLKPRNLSEPPTHIPGIFALGAGLDKFNANRIWPAGSETPVLQWTDRTSAGVKIWVGNFQSNSTDATFSVGRQLINQAPPPAVAVEPDTDRPGNDFLSRETSTLDMCAELCQGDSQCLAFTFYQGRCWLKNRVSNPVRLPGARSGVMQSRLAPPAQQAELIERDTDRPGSDYFSSEITDANACAARCRGDAQCRVFTYYQGRCWLKNAVPPAVKLQGATSGVLR